MSDLDARVASLRDRLIDYFNSEEPVYEVMDTMLQEELQKPALHEPVTDTEITTAIEVMLSPAHAARGIGRDEAKLMLESFLQGRAKTATVDPEDIYAEDKAVDSFAERMKWKLAKARERGKYGWQDKNWTPEQISQALREHVDKGDPVDVANYCMFLAARNEPITEQPAQEEITGMRRLIEAAEAVLSNEEHAVSCGARSYQKGSPTWQVFKELDAAIRASKGERT